MPRRSLTLALVAALGATVADAAPARAQAPIRLLTFNIRYGTANDGVHAWPNRRPFVMATIRDHAPHLLGLQEALRFQIDEILATMPGYRLVGVGRDDGRDAGEFSPLLVDTTRFAVVDEGTFWFSDTPEVPGSRSWGNGITRICSWARLADRATGDTVRAYNVHWDHESQQSRERSASLLLARIGAHRSARDGILVTGDFNSDEANPAYRAVTSDARTRLRDTFRARHPAATTVGTFNGFTGDSSGGKIDFILAGPGFETLDAVIDRRRFGPLWASDHFAVSAIVRR